MIQLSVKEYLKNKWFNFFSIILLISMILSSVILISTMEKQTRLYRMLKPYMGDKGIYGATVDDECIESLQRVDKVFAGSVTYCSLNDNEVAEMLVYDKRVERYFKPVLSEGGWLRENPQSEDMISAVISNNNLGIKTGDVITVRVTSQNGEEEQRQIYISGVFSDGQKIYNTEVYLHSDFKFSEMFDTYSYEQLDGIVLITNMKEYDKWKDSVVTRLYKPIIRFEDGITEEEMSYNVEVLDDYHSEISGLKGNIGEINDLGAISKRSRREMRSLYVSYIPLVMVAFILVCLGIIGINTVKTALNTKYFAKLYLCGMNWYHNMIFVTFEMIINCIAAFFLSVVIIYILRLFGIFGRVYAEIHARQAGFIILMCVAIIIVSLLMVCKVMHENSPVDILKDE